MNLKTLAQHLGLSPATVSRALNGHTDGSAATRQRVIEAARELGYVANPTARRLASGKAEAIGVVLPMPTGQVADPFFAELVGGIGEALEAHHLDLIVTALPAASDELATYRRLVERRRVDGLIVGRTRARDERLAYLRQRGFPFVAHGRTGDDEAYAWLDMDNPGAFAAATRRLLGLGHRRIALLNAPADLNFAGLRRQGFERAMAEAGVAADPRLVVEGPLSEAGGHDLTRHLLTMPGPGPTALLCGNDMMAMGALRAISEFGLVPGRDVSVIGYDDLPLASYTTPPLTTMRQPIRQAGRRLAEMLLELMAGTAPATLQETWPAELIVRSSDGPPPDPIPPASDASKKGRPSWQSATD